MQTDTQTEKGIVAQQWDGNKNSLPGSECLYLARICRGQALNCP